VTVFLVCVFPAVVIAESHSHGVEAWKSNTLAMMFHGLDEDVREDCKTAEAIDVKSMETKAKKVYVRLREGSRGETPGLLLRA
jgi:hypothetical protein